MEAIKVQQLQDKIIEAISKALSRNQKHMLVETPSGFGKSNVLVKTIEKLNELNAKKILIVTSTLTVREQIEKNILFFRRYIK